MSVSIPYLKSGDKVAIVATAKNFSLKDISPSFTWLKSQGFEVVKGENLSKKFHQFAGTDEQRLADFQKALNDTEIKAIFFVRGGYGTSRIIDKVDFTKFYKTPKWLIGFSDITVVHSHLQRNKFPSVHGPMPITFLKEGGEKSLDLLGKSLKGMLPEYFVKKHRLNKPGNGKGHLCGGNLTILHTILGTESEFDYQGKILFIEDIGEYLYHLDRMMVHLRRAGKLKNLAGLVVGHFSDMKDNPVPFGKTVEQIIAEAVEGYDYPVCFGFPSGHEAENHPLFLGYKAELMVNEKGATMRYSL